MMAAMLGENGDGFLSLIDDYRADLNSTTDPSISSTRTVS